MRIPAKIISLRKKIDVIDRKVIELLVERFRTTEQVQALKRKLGISITQKKREEQIIRRDLILSKKKLPPALVRQIFKTIFSFSKKSGIIKRWKTPRKNQIP